MKAEPPLEVRQTAVCLIVVAVALIVVGVVSGTLGRHVVQAVPAVVAAGLVLRWSAAGAWAAVGVFLVWLAAMAAIWAYLLGLSDIASGTYTNFEVFLTIVIAGCSAHGAQRGAQAGRGLALWETAVALAGGLGAQAAALALSIELFG